MTLASGVAGGATLVCTEGLSPPLSHVATPSTVSMSSSTTMITSTHERYSIYCMYRLSVCVCVCVHAVLYILTLGCVLRSLSVTISSHQVIVFLTTLTYRLHPTPSSSSINHYESDTGGSMCYMSLLSCFITCLGGGESIPWPEAMSKTIIIPAPNLTGKDIANLTSSASSSPHSTDNNKAPNDSQWPSTPTDPLPLDDHCEEGLQSPSSQSNHFVDSNASHAGGGVFGSSHVTAGGVTGSSSSPRPSILRKRPLER